MKKIGLWFEFVGLRTFFGMVVQQPNRHGSNLVGRTEYDKIHQPQTVPDLGQEKLDVAKCRLYLLEATNVKLLLNK